MPMGEATPRSEFQSKDSAVSAANCRSSTGPSSCAPAVSILGAPTSAMVNSRNSSIWVFIPSRS
ncbi:Uncharacterised protein [Mycobacteroides abscessus subsp. abscessus]|nr:Uncharacterised protein [Mycobacteroides abscessus subsp. abscessus]